MRTLLLTALLALPLPGFAADTYVFDTVHSQILFFADHLGFSKSQGEFLTFDGGFTFDEANPADATVKVAIQTASIDMDNQKWNDHMKNADFFDVEKFPTMTFTSTAVKPLENNRLEIVGDLTLLGVTRPVVLDTRLNKVGVHPRNGKTIAGFSATTTVKRSDFGMTYGVPAIGDDIEIRLEIEGVRQ